MRTWLVISVSLLAGAFSTPKLLGGSDSGETKSPLTDDAWSASWITHPTANLHAFAVFRFRKTIELPEKPAHFIVHVSGDRRYRFYVNGISACVGPQRSDPMAWSFETVDLAPYLHAGKNILSAAVWNYGDDAPYALMSVKTAFILQGDTDQEKVANTDEQWRVLNDESVAPRPVDRAALRTFIVVGPGETIDGCLYPWNWTNLGYDDSRWVHARVLEHGMPQGVGTDISWWLVARTLPPMEELQQRLARVRRAQGITATDAFLTGQQPLQIPANREVTLLLDQNFETNAFPHVIARGGRGAQLTLTYAEALVDSAGQKGHRDEIENRRIVGIEDAFLCDGRDQAEFSTLTFRTFRYLQLRIATKDEPLTVEDLYGVATGYPLHEEAHFESDAPDLAKIWEVGWRTARLCANETYFDCPYYEQLQYVGDTRIQALITLAVSGDPRLPRNAIEMFDRSRLPMGLTQSRYPSISPQIIPTFSLFWTQMLSDYDRYRSDAAFVRGKLMGIHDVMTWFEQRIDPKSGLLGPMPYWCFVDWADAWPWIDAAHPGGQPPGAREGGSAILTLQFAWALNDAAKLFSAYGKPEEGRHWQDLSEHLRRATIDQCWDPKRNLVSDTPAKQSFSQHANALAVLSDAIEGPRANELLSRTMAEPDLTPCTLYFRFYLLRALRKAGLGDRYVDELKPWREMIARGLTTFAERPDPTRSDCHAWSASPNYELLSTVCGIEPSSAGFATVRIEPHLGPLKRVHGTLPHPRGKIEVDLRRTDAGLTADIVLPPDVTGTFVWRGEERRLHPGTQHLEFKGSRLDS